MTSNRWGRWPRLESIFAAVVIMACLLSILIANSCSNQPVTRNSQKLTFGVNHDGGVVSRDHSDNSRNTQTDILSDESEELSLSDGILDWFNGSFVTVNISSKSHPYFRGYIIENQDLCKNQRVDLLIYMHSEVGRLNARIALRQTWANRYNFKDIRVKTVFFLGEVANPEDGPGVYFEQSTYHDIVQGEFQDNFRNLAVKSVMASQWISQHCAHARYVIKTDDDIFMDIFRFVEFLIPKLWKSTRTIMCHYQTNNSRYIQRDKKSRWYVPENFLPGMKRYPEFCLGYVVVMTNDVIPLLYEGSFTAPLISVDDAFLFGLSVPKSSPLKYVDISRNLSLFQDNLAKQYEIGNSFHILASTVRNLDSYEILWRKALHFLTPWGREHATGRVQKQLDSR